MKIIIRKLQWKQLLFGFKRFAHILRVFPWFSTFYHFYLIILHKMPNVNTLTNFFSTGYPQHKFIKINKNIEGKLYLFIICYRIQIKKTFIIYNIDIKTCYILKMNTEFQCSFFYVYCKFILNLYMV